MEYIILILLILNTTIAYATLFKRKFEETIILTITSYITTLFLTGVLGNLNVGFYIIIGANILLLGYNVYAIIKKKLSLKEQVFTFGFIIFIISYLLILWISIGRKSIEWDEFSHWGLVVKNMFSLGNLGLGADSNVLFKHYLSGTSMFQFFCTKLCGEFKESMLYIGMDLMIISTIIPMFKNIKSRKSLIAYICYSMIFFIPIYFYSSTYKTLYVDCILALTFAYTLYSCFFDTEEGINKFKIINLAASLSLLVLIKEFGLVLAVGSVFIILVDNIFVQNKFRIESLWNNAKYILLSVVPMIVIKVIWIFTLKFNSVTTNKASNILPTMLNFLKGNLLPYQQITMQNYKVALFETPLTIVYSFTFVMCLCLAIILAYIIVKNTNNKKSMQVMLSLSIIGAGAYATLLMFVPYLSMFSEYEAVRLASYSRYMNSYILGLIFMELALLVKELSDNKEKFEKFVLAFLAVFIISFPITYIEQFTVGARANVASTWQRRNEYEIFDRTIKNNVHEGETVYFIATNTDGGDFYIARYLATPIKISPKLSWSIGMKPYSDADIWTTVKSEEQWKQELVENYDYVYLYKVDETFIKNYGNLFYNGIDKIKNDQLYKVKKESNEQSILELVEE